MNEIGSFLDYLRQMLHEERQKQDALRSYEGKQAINDIFGDLLEDKIRRVREEIDTLHRDMESVTQRFLRVPPWHSRHRDALRRFSEGGSYESSVFVMTKFPEGDAPEDAQLKAVIQGVCSALSAHHFVPRIASGARFHEWMWDEVELHLLGCERGVAIVEDRYRPELNPNVAMEWGWMRAMGKRVLYLKEADFCHGRADMLGLRSWPFDWDDPGPGIRKAISEWLS